MSVKCPIIPKIFWEIPLVQSANVLQNLHNIDYQLGAMRFLEDFMAHLWL
jgi:hypothetical protein